MAEKNVRVAGARQDELPGAAEKRVCAVEKNVRVACATLVPLTPLQPVPDETYMRMALDEARLAAKEGEVPIGAVVVCGGERVRMGAPAGRDAAGDPDSANGAGDPDGRGGAGDPDGAFAWGIRGGEVVARAHNSRETDRDPSAHAEFAAMTAAARALGRWRLTGCTVYVTLEPCLMCAGLMVNARIDRCVYGAADPKGGALGTLYDVSHDERLNHEFEVLPGVLADECAEMLRSFFRARRRSWRGQG